MALFWCWPCGIIPLIFFYMYGWIGYSLFEHVCWAIIAAWISWLVLIKWKQIGFEIVLFSKLLGLFPLVSYAEESWGFISKPIDFRVEPQLSSGYHSQVSHVGHNGHTCASTSPNMCYPHVRLKFRHTCKGVLRVFLLTLKN